MIEVVLLVLGGGEGVLGRLYGGELDIWGPLLLFAGLGGVCEFVVSQGHSIGVGVGIGGSIPVDIVGEGDSVWGLIILGWGGAGCWTVWGGQHGQGI